MIGCCASEWRITFYAKESVVRRSDVEPDWRSVGWRVYLLVFAMEVELRFCPTTRRSCVVLEVLRFCNQRVPRVRPVNSEASKARHQAGLAGRVYEESKVV